MTSADMLEQWGQTHIHNSRFLGVFPADRLPAPDDFEPPVSAVCNYDPANMPCSHWVAVLIRPLSVEWFDSFGLAPDSSDLFIGHRTYFRAWLSRVCRRFGLKSYEYNCADLQSLSEVTCGHWAVYFAKNGAEAGWGGFGPDREKNDRLIRQLVRFS